MEEEERRNFRIEKKKDHRLKIMSSNCLETSPSKETSRQSFFDSRERKVDTFLSRNMLTMPRGRSPHEGSEFLSAQQPHEDRGMASSLKTQRTQELRGTHHTYLVSSV